MKSLRLISVISALFAVLLFSSCGKSGSVVYDGSVTVSYFGVKITGSGKILFSKSQNEVYPTIKIESSGVVNYLYLRGKYDGDPFKPGKVLMKVTEYSDDENDWKVIGYEYDVPVEICQDFSIKMNLTPISKLHPLLSCLKNSVVILNKTEEM